MKVYIDRQVHWRIEDFHFAYQIYTLEDGTEIVRIHDAVHSLLYK